MANEGKIKELIHRCQDMPVCWPDALLIDHAADELAAKDATIAEQKATIERLRGIVQRVCALDKMRSKVSLPDAMTRQEWHEYTKELAQDRATTLRHIIKDAEAALSATDASTKPDSIETTSEHIDGVETKEVK